MRRWKARADAFGVKVFSAALVAAVSFLDTENCSVSAAPT